MQGGELVVGRGDELHEVGADHVGVFAGERALHVGVDDAGFCDVLAHVVVDELGVVLRADARERFALGLWDAELLEGVLDVRGDVVPALLHVGLRADVGGDLVHIEAVDRRAPVRNGDLMVDFEGFQPECEHPVGVVLGAGDLAHDLGGEALFHAVEALLVFLVAEVVQRALRLVGEEAAGLHGGILAVFVLHGYLRRLSRYISQSPRG